MTRKILNWWTDAVLWEGEADTVKDAIHAALASGANLRGANLRDADLAGANLTGANLTRAYLTDANLGGANLTDANLTGADLTGANLTDANLTDANLRGANLTYANLTDANLRDANLTDANLTDANLRGANLTYAKNMRLPTGETWAEYLTDTVPALLTAGGKSLKTFADHWQCHLWENCPMHHAFDASGIEGVPVLMRPRAEQFIQLFDARLIPWPLPTKEQP